MASAALIIVAVMALTLPIAHGHMDFLCAHSEQKGHMRLLASCVFCTIWVLYCPCIFCTTWVLYSPCGQYVLSITSACCPRLPPALPGPSTCTLCPTGQVHACLAVAADHWR